MFFINVLRGNLLRGRYSDRYSLAAGLICGLIFAPIFFLPALLTLSILARQVASAESKQQAFKYGYLFGVGFFLTTLYWISIGVTVYLDEFWWAIPFALLGLPLFMALFTGIATLAAWHSRMSKYYHFSFCLCWLFTEWLTSWLFSGLPWALLGYGLSCADILIQSASLYSVFGLSFICVYTGSSLYNIDFTNKAAISAYKTDNINLQNSRTEIIVSIILIVFIVIHGVIRLNNNPTLLSNIKVRIVQPSIAQTDKWEEQQFWQNLAAHIELSKRLPDEINKQMDMEQQIGIIPDIILWSEAALTVPYYHKSVLHFLRSVFTKENQILILGGISDNNIDIKGINRESIDKEGKADNDYKIYSAMLALNPTGELQFDYHKSHLVPFGEYIPFKNFLLTKKITHGLQDYSPGKQEIVTLTPFNLRIKPLICYEAIFPFDVRQINSDADLIINITNDAWYGNSSGPYQHFVISKMRSVENGLPILRAGNNGISAIIDPLGRVLAKLNLNKIGILDGFIPIKIADPTLFCLSGYSNLLILVAIVLILQLFINKIFKYYKW